MGKGPLEALVASLPVKVEIMDYSEHAIGGGANAKAAAYIELRLEGAARCTASASTRTSPPPASGPCSAPSTAP